MNEISPFRRSEPTFSAPVPQHSYLRNTSVSCTAQNSSGKKGYIVIAIFLVGFVAFFGLIASFGSGLYIPPEHTEKLVLATSTDASNSTLIITTFNNCPYSATVTQVLFNNASVPLSSITPEGSFNKTSAGAFMLASGTEGELLIGRSTLNVSSGQSYDIAVITAAGNSYLCQAVWP